MLTDEKAAFLVVAITMTTLVGLAVVSGNRPLTTPLSYINIQSAQCQAQAGVSCNFVLGTRNLEGSWSVSNARINPGNVQGNCGDNTYPANFKTVAVTCLFETAPPSPGTTLVGALSFSNGDSVSFEVTLS